MAKTTKRYRIGGKIEKRTSIGERYKKFHYTRLSPDRARANARRDAVRGTLSQSAFVHCSLKDVMRFRNNNTLDRTQVGIRGQLHHLASSRCSSMEDRKKKEKKESTRGLITNVSGNYSKTQYRNASLCRCTCAFQALIRSDYRISVLKSSHRDTRVINSYAKFIIRCIVASSYNAKIAES